MRSARTFLALALYGAAHFCEWAGDRVKPPGGLVDGTEVFDMGPDLDRMVEEARGHAYQQASVRGTGPYAGARCPDRIPGWVLNGDDAPGDWAT